MSYQCQKTKTGLKQLSPSFQLGTAILEIALEIKKFQKIESASDLVSQRYKNTQAHKHITRYLQPIIFLSSFLPFSHPPALIPNPYNNATIPNSNKSDAILGAEIVDDAELKPSFLRKNFNISLHTFCATTLGGAAGGEFLDLRMSHSS